MNGLIQCNTNNYDSDRETYEKLLNTSQPLPENLVRYPNQIGGHGMLFGNKCRVLYQKKKNTVYKSVQSFPKGPHELAFYKLIFSDDTTDPVFLELRQFLPRYYGTFYEAKTNTFFFSMEDLLHHLYKPSACDLKIGRTTYAPDASPSKVMVEKAKYKWREQVGFLITGMKVYDPFRGEHINLDIFHGRTLNPETIYQRGLRIFLGADVPRARRLARSFVVALRRLSEWFEKQRQLAFYSTSLLLAYGSPVNIPSNNEKRCNRNGFHSNGQLMETDEKEKRSEREDEVVVVRMVDFTHWYEAKHQPDQNFMYGLQQLINWFELASLDDTPLTMVEQM